jgi:amidohydrolase
MFSMTRADQEKAIQQIIPQVQSLRRELHQHPEIRFEEHRTSDRIAAELSDIGFSVKRGYARGTGLTGTIGKQSGRVIALRAELDGLEMEEETGVPYASKTTGRMHACGHDGHMAMLCGAGRILAEHANELECGVRLIFQPGEEVGCGGKLMVEEGVLDNVSAVFGMHGWPTIPLGKIGLKSGAAMAGADWFRITVHGKGCHGASPASGVDPILAAAHIVVGLQSIVSRELDLCEPAVVSVGRVQADGTNNIIPEKAEISGTFRTFSEATRTKICEAISRVAHNAAAMLRATATVHFDAGAYASLHNDPSMCDFARQAISAGLGDNVILDDVPPSMAAEDFAYYLQRVPGAFLWLGTHPATKETTHLHSLHFDFNDSVLATGIGAWLSLVSAFERKIV